ncbi:MAG TPA: VWA domain-containing protein [Acidimicrobiales bacterium]|nr:VWA domain-containing protein [Acidimicrobiales bacterium]
MPIEFSSPTWLWALVLLVPVALVWRAAPGLWGPAQRRACLGTRMVLVSGLVLALAGPKLEHTASSQTLVVAADLSASTASAQQQELADVEELSSGLPSKDELGVVSFGENALVEAPPQHDLAFQGFATSPGANFTNIEAALRLAGSMTLPGTRRHVLLISDGRQNVGDAVGEARALRADGVRVDVLPLEIAEGPDVRVDSVSVPATVPPSTRALATAILVSNETTRTRVVWALDQSQVVSDTVVEVKPGVTQLHALLPPAGPGFHEVTVQIAPAVDTVPGNDLGEALFQVLGRQQVLVVEGQPGAGRNVAGALRSAGTSVQVVAPSQVPLTVAGVARWQAVALVNVSAAELGAPRMTAIADATRDLGTGLAAFGGAATFGPGGWAGTPLERALPIEMKIPNLQEKPPVAVMLVLETVESPAGDAVVRSAVSQLIANLSPQDLVGATNGSTGVAVPLQPVGNGKRVENEIANISLGDPPSYVPYLQEAASALDHYPEATKYILLIGDGDALFPLPSASFISNLVHEGITVSTIGTDVHGSPLYMSYMAAIAAEGNGRFYDSESAYQLPSIFLDETQTQLEPWVVQERFRAVAGAATAALGGVDPSQIPPLDGYVAATAKPTSSVVLSGPNGDPLLAQWQYGLGTAVAWTSDTEGRWTTALLRSPIAGKLLAGIVSATLPLEASPGFSLSVQVEGDQAHLVAQASGIPPDATAIAHVVGPDDSASEIPLSETAPGRFEGDFPTSDIGDYLIRAAVSAKGQALRAGTVGTAIAYSPELRFTGTDMATLSQVASAGGGAVVSSPREAISEPVPPVKGSEELAMWLLVGVIVLLPLDVALRRLDLSTVRGKWAAALHVPHPARRGAATSSTAAVPAGAHSSARQPASQDAQRSGDVSSSAAPAAPAAQDQPLASRLLERLRK